MANPEMLDAVPWPFLNLFLALPIDRWSTCKYRHYTSKTIQLRHVPDSLHRRLKARAAMSGLPLSDFLIKEVRKIAEHLSAEELRDRFRQRDPYRGTISPASVIRMERDTR